MNFSRRAMMGVAASGLIVRPAWAAPRQGGVLIVGLDPEPLALSSAGSIDAGASIVGPKIFDRLFDTDLTGRLVPQLALSGQVSRDGLSVRINLRPGVNWHDGQPLTSADVAYSISEVWKRYHPRSQMAFENLLGVDTPTRLQAVIRFSKPAPYIFSTLADGASQVVPRHIYAGKDVLTNRNNLAPVGSGPFQFESWERGSHIVLKRNPNYWDSPRPYLDKVIFRFIQSGAPLVAALQTGEIQYASAGVPLSEVQQLQTSRSLWVHTQGPNYSANFVGFAFNLDRPALRDARVRQAFAYAIDKSFLLRNVWLGHGILADSPIPPGTEFHAPGLPQYPLDLARAGALLDAAGLRRGANGVRITLKSEIMPSSTLHPLMAEFIRSSLSKIGVKLELRKEDLPTYLRRIFTTRDFDTETYSTGSDFDPALGIQRFYWSKSIEPGVPFTNPTHYASPAVDALLEAGRVEPDRVKRRAIYFQVQSAVQRDLPLIPVLFPSQVEVGSRKLFHPFITRIDNLAGASLVA